MNRSFFAVPAMICLVAVSITAQAPAEQPTTPKPAAQQPERPAESSIMTANKLTYSGCLKPGTTTGTWILESAEVAPKAGAAPSSVGTSGAAKMTLNLDPAATVNLKPHANHKVEVVGLLSPAKPGAEAAPSSAAAAQALRQQFSVESMKMVSATCP
jgi:hypothetical protein